MIQTPPDRPDRARPPPRPGGAAGRRHADHPEARRRPLSASTPGAPTLGALHAPGRMARGPPRLTTPCSPPTSPTCSSRAARPPPPPSPSPLSRFRATLAGQADPRRGTRPRACWAGTAARPPTGAGARPSPTERGRARRDSRHRRTAPHGRPGRRIPHHSAPPGPTRRRDRLACCLWAGCGGRKSPPCAGPT